MKILSLPFVLVTLLALGCSAFQVTSPKLVFGPDETGLVLSAPSGGHFDDYFISTCRRDYFQARQSTPLYKKKADGTYEMFLFPELQICPSPKSSDFIYATTNGKWIFITAYNTTIPRSSYSSFFSLTNESNLILATRYDEDPLDLTFIAYAKFISEDTLATVVLRVNEYQYQFVEWKYDGSGWNITSEQNVASVDLNNLTSAYSIFLDPPTSDIGIFNNAPMLFSKPQENYQWAASALFGQDYFEVYETNGYTAPLFYNGNNTAIYVGATPLDWSSGTLYIADYQKSNNTWHIAKKFNAEDIGLDGEYLNLAYSWVKSVVWINQDMAFLMAPNFPLNFNGSDYMYGGNVVMLYRDKSNQWQMGGRIAINGDDGSGEAVQLTYLTRTKNDLIITGNILAKFGVTAKYVLYTYPLCFPNKMNFTCHQNVSVTLCTDTDFTIPSDTRSLYSYVDDKCGEPMMTVSHVDITNGAATADLKFERLGLEVGQCTASFSFYCPPLPPVPKVSGAVLMGFNSDITKFMALITIAMSLVL